MACIWLFSERAACHPLHLSKSTDTQRCHQRASSDAAVRVLILDGQADAKIAWRVPLSTPSTRPTRDVRNYIIPSVTMSGVILVCYREIVQEYSSVYIFLNDRSIISVQTPWSYSRCKTFCLKTASRNARTISNNCPTHSHRQRNFLFF